MRVWSALVATLGLVVPTVAEAVPVTYTLASGRTAYALLQIPATPGPKPAVVYLHGARAERQQLTATTWELPSVALASAAGAGYNVGQHVNHYAANGFVTIAPIRRDYQSTASGGVAFSPWSDPIWAEYDDLIDTTVAFVAGLPNVTNVYLVGCSKGGLLTLQQALRDRGTNLSAVISISGGDPAGALPSMMDYTVGWDSVMGVVDCTNVIADLVVPLFSIAGQLEVGTAIYNSVGTLRGCMSGAGSARWVWDYAFMNHQSFYRVFRPGTATYEPYFQHTLDWLNNCEAGSCTAGRLIP